MRNLKTILILILATYLFGCQSTGPSVKLTTPTGYSTNGLNYLPAKDKPAKEIVFIALHGKSSQPDRDHQLALYTKLTAAGYEVIAPKMPWSSEWNGTFTDGMRIIDAAAESVIKRGKKPVVIGHSLGGAGSLIYASEKPMQGILGIVTVAPGHMLHRSNRMQSVSADSVDKARKMVAAGNGNTRASFMELNTGKVRSKSMSANTYLSYYDTDKFPNIEFQLNDIKTPLLWIAGSNDRLTNAYDMETLFEEIPKHKHSKYLVVDGGHKDVLGNSAQEIIDWSESLQ